MKKTSDCREALLALVKAGLWGETNDNEHQNENLFEVLDWGEIQRLAEEQSVVGLVAVGLEKIPTDVLPLVEKLTLLGKCQLIEQRNVEMNAFMAELVQRMRDAGIEVVLVKGQGVAQCYEKPLWRAAGDIDFILDEYNYQKAKAFLKPIAEHVSKENETNKHQALTIKSFNVELHGRLPIEFSRRADKVIDEVVAESCKGDVCLWKNGMVDVPLPNADNHVFLVFTHFLNHFFIEGVGLKQICDWCRLLWTCRDDLDRQLLEQRLLDAGLMSEWKVFASLAVNTLGMPQETMPFYDDSPSYRRKARRVLSHILKSGNLGHNNNVSYRVKHSAFVANVITFIRRLRDFAGFALIFPLDSPKFFLNYCTYRIKQYGNR